jgi:hypothetical protein
MRAYLTAGFSTVALGAIIAAPMNPLSPRAASPQPQVRTNGVQLAAATTPLTPDRFADRPGAVHVLAEISRGLESIKAANSSSGRANALLSSAAPARAELRMGVVTAVDPATAPAPATDNRRSSTAPRNAAVNAIDAPGIANVLAHTAELALDAVIAEPALLVGDTVFNVDRFLIDVATLDPDTVSQAIPNFIARESDSIHVAVDGLRFDARALQDAIGHLFGVDDDVTAAKLAKTTAPSAKAGAAESGAAESGTAESGATQDAAPKKQRGHVAGKGAQHKATGSAQDASPAGVNDRAVKTGKPADTTSDAVSDSKHTTAEPTATSSKKNTSDTKPGGASEPKRTKEADNPTKKTAHTGGQSTGNASKSGGAKHAKHHG